MLWEGRSVRSLKALSIFLISTIVVACQYPLQVHVEGSLSAPTFFVQTQDGLIDAPPACVSEFAVTETKTSQTMWAAESKDLGCHQLNKITYGDVPPQFVQNGVLRPLKPDTDYDVFFGTGQMHGGLKFRWHAGQFAVCGDTNGAPASAACGK
jgi:hypothetical protein